MIRLPTRRRGWARFSLRTLLVLLTLGCVWLGVHVERARRQQHTIAWVNSVQGRTFYEYQHGYPDWRSYPGVQDDPPPGPAWLRAYLAQDYFSNVVWIDLPSADLILSPKRRLANIHDHDLARLASFRQLSNLQISARITDRGLAHLSRLTNLQRVSIAHATITDAGLQQLRNLRQLKALCIYGPDTTGITDRGLAALEQLTDLRELRLLGTYLTDSGLKYVKRLSKLESLDLYGSLISDAGIKELGELSKLMELNLVNTRVGDAGLEPLKNCKQLGSLELAGTRVTNTGLKHLGSLPRLHHLNLDSTAVDDVGLNNLRSCRQLTGLTLFSTKVTERGIKALQQAMPQLRYVGRAWPPTIHNSKP